jgi:hypothetical protein
VEVFTKQIHALDPAKHFSDASELETLVESVG